MKRFLTLLISLVVLVLLLLCNSAVADDAIEFNAALTNSMDKKSSEWMATSMDRAYLTDCLLLDLMAAKNEDFVSDALTGVMQYDSYVGRQATTLFVLIALPERTLVLLYMPAIKTAQYMISDLKGWSQKRISEALEKVAIENSDKYYKNNREQINDVFEYVLEIIQASK